VSGAEREPKALLSAPRNSQPFPRYVRRRGGFEVVVVVVYQFTAVPNTKLCAWGEEGLDTLFSLISRDTSHW
jgi:hypothetical protein